MQAKPDMSLYSAKRKAATQDFPSGEPSAIGMNKKLKEEWSCELCQIKATSENDLNDHLNGKKHKVREARQKREIDRHNKKSQNTVIEVTDTAVNSIISGVDAEKDQKTPNCCIVLNVMNENVVDTKSNNEEQLLETMVDNGVSVTESKNGKKLEETTVDERVTESKNEEQLLETVLDNGVSLTESKNEKLGEMMVDERVTESKNEKELEEMKVDERVTESKNEKKLEEMAVDERITESKNEEQLLETVLDNGVSVTESKNEKKLEEMAVDERVTESKNEEQLLETVLDHGVSVTESKNEKKLEEMTDDERVTESKNEKKPEEMTVDEKVTESKNEEQHVEKNQNVDFFESKKGAATEEAGKSALTEIIKARGLWCELCQIGTNSQTVMEGHLKGKKHIKKMNQFNKKNVSLPSTSFVSSINQVSTDGVKKETDQMMTHMTNTRDGI